MKYTICILLSITLLTGCTGQGTSQGLDNSANNSSKNINVVQPVIQLITPTAAPTEVKPKPVEKPIIQSLTPNPTQVFTKDSVITFSAIVHNPSNDVLTYVWSVTKGTPSATGGEVFSWRPQSSDGQVETGTATVTLLVHDNKGQNSQLSVNLIFDDKGGAKIEGGTSVSPTSTVTASPEFLPIPTPSASSVPTSSPTVSEPGL